MSIVEGGARNNYRWFIAHLQNDKDNERVRLLGATNTVSTTLAGAFKEMYAVSKPWISAQRKNEPRPSKNPNKKTPEKHEPNWFYHAYISPEPGEFLSDEQWEKAISILEKHLGLTGQARFAEQHFKKGREHVHCIWNRVRYNEKLKRFTTVHDSNNRYKHMNAAREIEKELGLKITLDPRHPDFVRKNPRIKNWEYFRGQVSKINPLDVTAEVKGLRKLAKSGTHFRNLLLDAGYLVVRGDKTDFCIVDTAGHEHSLPKRSGMKKAELRELMKDVDKDKLLSVPEGKELQKELRRKIGETMPDSWQSRLSEIQKEEERKEKAVQKDEAEKQKAYLKDIEDRNKGFADDEDKKNKAIAEEQDKKQREIAEQYEKDEENKRQTAKEQEQRLEENNKRILEQTKEMERKHAFLEKAILEEHNREQSDVAKEYRLQQRTPEQGAVREAHSRYGEALAQNYDIRDPYGSLAKSAMAEHGQYLRDRRELDRQIANETDPHKRKGLELRKEIEYSEYMALTSNRIATQSEIIVGRLGTEEAKNQRQRAAEYTQHAQELRREYREHQRPTGLQVVQYHEGKEWGQRQQLTDYAKNKAPVDEKILGADMHRMMRGHAIRSIKDDIKFNRPLNKAHVDSLSQRDIQGINKQGDKYLKDLVQQKAKDRDLER